MNYHKVFGGEKILKAVLAFYHTLGLEPNESKLLSIPKLPPNRD